MHTEGGSSKVTVLTNYSHNIIGSWKRKYQISSPLIGILGTKYVSKENKQIFSLFIPVKKLLSAKVTCDKDDLIRKIVKSEMEAMILVDFNIHEFCFLSSFRKFVIS